MQKDDSVTSGATDLIPATFFQRLTAIVVDGIILCIVTWPLLYLIGYYMGRALALTHSIEEIESQVAALANFLGLILSWLYFSLQESSKFQATLGKRAFNIKVGDMDGNRISFSRASARHFGKIISALLLFVGFIMAATTKKRQALHDIMANCLVLRKGGFDLESKSPTRKRQTDRKPPPLPIQPPIDLSDENKLTQTPKLGQERCSSIILAHDNAQLALRFRPEVRELWAKVDNLPAQAQKPLLNILSENPKCDINILQREYNEQLKLFTSPFKESALNKVFTDLCFSPQAQEEFRAVVELLGETIDYDELKSRILRSIAESEYELWLKKPAGRYINPNDIVLLRAITGKIIIEHGRNSTTIQPGQRGLFVSYWSRHSAKIGLEGTFKLLDDPESRVTVRQPG